MWTMTNFGMFSATLRDERYIPKGDTQLLQIRARRAQDLRTLKERYLPEASDIVRLQHADYEFRVFCSHDEWALALARMAQDVDYQNFKNSVRDRQLHNAYLRVWNALYDTLATNKYIWTSKKGKKIKKSTSTVSTSYTGDIWAGWEDVTYPSDDEITQRLEDKYPHLNWR